MILARGDPRAHQHLWLRVCLALGKTGSATGRESGGPAGGRWNRPGDQFWGPPASLKTSWSPATSRKPSLIVLATSSCQSSVWFSGSAPSGFPCGRRLLPSVCGEIVCLMFLVLASSPRASRSPPGALPAPMPLSTLSNMAPEASGCRPPREELRHVGRERSRVSGCVWGEHEGCGNLQGKGCPHHSVKRQSHPRGPWSSVSCLLPLVSSRR